MAAGAALASQRPEHRIPNILAWGVSSAGFLLLSLVSIQMLAGAVTRQVAIVPMWIAYACVVTAVSMLLDRSRRRCERWHAAFANQLYLHGARPLSVEDAGGWLDACWYAPGAQDLLSGGAYARWAMMWAGRYSVFIATNPSWVDARASIIVAASLPTHLVWSREALRECQTLRASGYEVTLVDGAILVEADKNAARSLEGDPLAGARLCTVATHAAKMATLLGATPASPQRT